MKALIKQKIDSYGLTLCDVPMPNIKEMEVLVKVEAVAICGSDVHIYQSDNTYDRMKDGTIIGHEYSGEIIQIGSRVKNYQIGDKVIGESNIFCGICEACAQHKTHLCENYKMTGIDVDGAMAQYVAVNEKMLHKISDEITTVEASVIQPMSVSINAIYSHSTINEHSSVVVFGPGIQGIIAAVAARSLGAKKVVVVGMNQDEKVRLSVARKLGLLTVNIEKENVEDVLYKQWGIRKVSHIVEASGSIHAFKDALSLITRGGEIVVFGIYARTFECDLTYLVRNEIQIATSYTSNASHYEQALELLESRAIDIKALIQTYPFENYQEAFEDAINQRVMKPVLII